jgi:hypothetical protein
MSTIQENVLNNLRSLRSLVGEVVFRESVMQVLNMAEQPSVSPTPVEKKVRTRNITDEQRAVITQNMAALQAFTKAERLTAGEDVPYSDVKKAAGEKWKALTKEQKGVWMSQNIATTVSTVPEVKVEASEEKRGRGRPKSSTVNVKRLSKTETAALE